MKKSFYQYFSFVLAMTLVAPACKKDFITLLPETTRVTDNVYKTAADFNTAVVGAYSTFKHNGLYGNFGVTSS